MKTYAILPIESESLKFEAMTFSAEKLEDVLIVHVPDSTNVEDRINFRDKLLVAFPDKTVIVVPKSVKFCRIQEVN